MRLPTNIRTLMAGVLMLSAGWMWFPGTTARAAGLISPSDPSGPRALLQAEVTPEPTPETTGESPPTQEPTMEPSPTVEPTATLEATAAELVAAPQVMIPGPPYPDAPLCPDHDPRAYHGLWDSARGCHYDHHHGDAPHAVDDIFGTDYYTWAGGSISYPWQTFNAQTGCLENDCKHSGYIWLVRRDQPCESRYTNGCVVAFRALVHAMSSVHDTSVRYHSAWLEALVCREDAPNVCGVIRSGGWQDTGDLLIDRRRIIDYPNNFNRIKLHSFNNGTSHVGTWYAGSPGGEERRGGMWSVAVELGDMWGPIDPADQMQVQFFCPDPTIDCRWNGSTYQPHNVAVGFPPRFRALVDPDGNRIADYHGHADRWGNPVSGCSSVGLDCVPLVLEGVPLGYEYQGRFEYREYDVLFDRHTSGWIQPPH